MNRASYIKPVPKGEPFVVGNTSLAIGSQPWKSSPQACGI